MAEMIYRLKAGITNKPSSTYEILNGEGVFLSAFNLTQQKTYSYSGTVLSFKVPSDWPLEQQGGSEMVASNDPYYNYLWSVNFAPDAGTYDFTVFAYVSGPARLAKLRTDSNVQIISDTQGNGTEIVVYNHLTMADYKEALLITGKIDYIFSARAGNDPSMIHKYGKLFE